MTARKLITIEGEQRPCDQGTWVVFNKDGHPTGCMVTSAATGDDPVKAAREFWDGNAEAMRHLVEGYRIVLMTRERYSREVYPRMLSAAREELAARVQPQADAEQDRADRADDVRDGDL